MTIIIIPTEKCNLKCLYCFEPEEQRTGLDYQYSYEAIERTLHEVWSGKYNGSDVCLHGGECTLIPIEELEKLLKLIHDLPWKGGGVKGVSSIVTNGTLITNEHIELFKKYNTHVGISIDGPTSLNQLRGYEPFDDSLTTAYNNLINHTIKRLLDAGVSVSIMCILHTRNAGTVGDLERLGQWMKELVAMGITSGRFNPMYSDEFKEYELSNDQLFRAWNYLYRMTKWLKAGFNPMVEMRKNLIGKPNKRGYIQPSPCIFTKCDLFNTKTFTIMPDGSVANCDRTFAKGIYARSASDGDSGRYKSLEQTQCKGCRWWLSCVGGCPMEGEGGDWRNKTRFCGAIKKFYKFLEADLARSEGIIYLGGITAQETSTNVDGNVDHGDNPHGDNTHGDSHHGDSAHGDAPHADSNHADKPASQR